MIPLLVSLIVVMAAVGIVMVLIMFLRIRSLDAEAKLKKHRSRQQGVADLLNYAAVVDDGVIVCKNGAFMASWVYQGDDIASSVSWYRCASTRHWRGWATAG